jgi:hypothetical protein
MVSFKVCPPREMRYSIYGYCHKIWRDQAKILEIDLMPGKNDIIGNQTN